MRKTKGDNMPKTSKKARLKELYDSIRVPRGGNTPQNHTKGLYDLIDDIKTKLGTDITMIEIGSYAGVSTEIFALNFKNIIAIDAWVKSLELGYAELNKEEIMASEKQFDEMSSKYKNIKKVVGFSDKAHEQYEDESIDCVYIDANHEYKFVKQDILCWGAKVKKGGIIAGHDYKNILGVREAVNDVLGTPDKLYDDCSWIKYK